MTASRRCGMCLLHSLAHALIRQFAVECGYTTASIRERIYSRPPGNDKEPMAGILLYTAAPDSEGTLGGLVALGEPKSLGRHLDQALDAMRLCASDPLCAEHHPMKDGLTLHGAACHACLFLPETSCERGQQVPGSHACSSRRSSRTTWRSSPTSSRPSPRRRSPPRPTNRSRRPGRWRRPSARPTSWWTSATSESRMFLRSWIDSGPADARGRLRASGRQGAGLCPGGAGLARAQGRRHAARGRRPADRV